MDCPTHTHQKWDCPKSNGRHIWLINWGDIPLKFQISEDKIGIPVHCAHDCGAYAIEFYKFDEIIEGE